MMISQRDGMGTTNAAWGAPQQAVASNQAMMMGGTSTWGMGHGPPSVIGTSRGFLKSALVPMMRGEC